MENEYLVMLHNLDAGSSELLGSFNDADEYVIEEDIKQELCKANKLIKEYKQDKIDSVATIGSYTFDFVTYVQLGENNKKRLTLFLVEKCKLGFVDKELLTLVKSVIIENQNVLEVVKKEFNMYIADESTGIDMANESLLAIINKKAQVGAHAKFLISELKNTNKGYVLKMLSLIKASGGYGNQLLAQFKNIVKAKKLDKNSEKYWSELKNIIDKLVLDNAIIFNGKVKDRINDLQENYRNILKNTKEPKKEEVKPVKKGGKKPAKKAKPAKGFEGVKPSLTKAKPYHVDFFDIFAPKPPFRPKRAHTPHGSPAANISNKPPRQKDPFNNLMGSIYSNNLHQSRTQPQPQKQQPQPQRSNDGGRDL
ncbi:MAG: hypothetical protein E7376_05250 [Clostridiales bacterium]|nr:hypothetical protein [Clostridiales bacterium]